MAQSRSRSRSLVLVVVLAGMLLGVGLLPAAADVTAVTGSAFGYHAYDITLFGGAQPEQGPAPTVALGPNASNSPQNDHVDSAQVQYGPAVLFRSGPIDVHAEATLGAGGSVTTSADVRGAANPDERPGPFLYDRVQATCNADESGVTPSVTVTNGVVETRYDPDTQEPVETQNVPANPPRGYTVEGTIDHVGDRFRIVFNEQTTNADGSVTVNAAHMYLLGPTATGHLIIGQAVCGVTATAATTTTTSTVPTTTTSTTSTTTTTVPGSTTTTTVPGSSTTTTTTLPGGTTTVPATTAPTTTVPGGTTAPPATTVPPTTTTVPPATTTTVPAGGGGTTGGADATAGATQVAGGAFGYFSKVGLFGGPQTERGPQPVVTLPPGGAAAPVTATAPSASAVYGPAVLFESGQLRVSTQGQTGAAASVTSSSSIADVGPGPLTAEGVSSSCTADRTAQSATVNITNGRLVVSQGADLDDPSDDEVVQLPANPSPNTTFEGTIENVGDNFRVVLNEQVKSAGGITVNAVHMHLLGPIAVGDLIIGQSRCAIGTAAIGVGSGTATGGAGQLSDTGADPLPLAALAGTLLLTGAGALYMARRRSVDGPRGA